MTLALQDFNSAAVLEPSAVETDAAPNVQRTAASVLTWWTEERVEQLRELWATGDSAAIIANLMRTTRNAILGKRYRLGLSDRAVLKCVRRHYPNRPKRALKTVFPNRERKPHFPKLPSPPPLVAVTSVITGSYVTTKRMRPHVGEQTKNQLRAMLTQAVKNTAELEILA